MEREAKLQAEADREVEAHKAQLREKKRKEKEPPPPPKTITVMAGKIDNFSSWCAPGFYNPDLFGLCHFYVAVMYKTNQNQLKKPSVIRLLKFTSINLAEICH